MKKKLFISMVISMLCSLLLISCQDNRDTRDDTGTLDEETDMPGAGTNTDATDDFWDTEREYTYNDREEFQTEFRDAREKLDQKINELQQKADNATGEMKESLNNQVDKLKDKRDDLDSKWRDFSNTTEENWEDFKSEINTAWNDVETTWQDAGSEFKDDM